MKLADATNTNRKFGKPRDLLVRLDVKQRPSLLRHYTPGKLFRTNKALG